MESLSESLRIALNLVVSLDPDLGEVVLLSLRVSFSALVISSLVGLPLGALLATSNFRGRGAVIIAINALMGLPPVVVGLFVYMMFSNSGPLGWLQLLYTCLLYTSDAADE